MKELNLVNFYQKFTDENACLAYLEQVRWPNGRICPHCGSVKSYRFKDGKLFKCADCRKQFTAKVGTIFTDSHIPLQKWYLAIYLLTSQKKGISSIRMAEYLQIMQSSAWFMLQRIRYAMEYGLDKPFEGIAEMDGTQIGGRTTSTLRNTNKMTVLGIVEKQKKTGRLVTKVTKHEDATVARNFLKAVVRDGAIIHTDEGTAFYNLKKNYDHRGVAHSKHEYVREDTHVNTIEGAWSHLKLGIKAIYVGVSHKHLQKYCWEFSFRYSTRNLSDGERFNEWFTSVNGKHLPYKKLVHGSGV